MDRKHCSIINILLVHPSVIFLSDHSKGACRNEKKQKVVGLSRLVIDRGTLRDYLLHFSKLTGNSCVYFKRDSHYL